MLVGLVWLNNNQMFGSGDFVLGQIIIEIFENFEIASFCLENFKMFKNVLW